MQELQEIEEEEDVTHYDHVILALERGELIPFLGAGINLFNRDECDDFQPNTHLPSGKELATYLARIFTYKRPDKNNLLRVSQYGATMLGPSRLYNRLVEVFDADYPINDLHRFLARLPSILTEQKKPEPYQLIVTTNYDDVLEQAFREAKEPFDIVTYGAKGPDVGKFRHIPHGALPREGAALIRSGELKDIPRLANRLRNGEDDCSLVLKARFSPALVRSLEEFDSSVPIKTQFSNSLVSELNQLLRTPLFEEDPFAKVELTGEALELRDRFRTTSTRSVDDVVRLNRFLLEETYPHEITRSLRTYIPIKDPNAYNDLPFDDDLKPKHTVILKIHGAVDRVADRRRLPPNLVADSFVITEDDYINYLAHTDISKLVPVQLQSKLTNSGFLFLGYGLGDWNLRVIMHRIWGEHGYGYSSWAIQKQAEEFDVELWSKRSVRIISIRLEDYIKKLEKRLRQCSGGHDD